jgi:hypothetical protein
MTVRAASRVLRLFWAGAFGVGWIGNDLTALALRPVTGVHPHEESTCAL